MTKSEIRTVARQRLHALTPQARAAAGEEIARRVWTLPEIAGASVILLYASLPSEVPTDAIAAEARRRGIGVTYPRCLPAKREMALHRVSRDEDLLPAGAYGIREPAGECPLVEVRDIDIGLIPGLAWDRMGGRLGRGAGYYDRLLARADWRGFRCGLFFATQEFRSIPLDSWDVPLDAVVTETEATRVR